SPRPRTSRGQRCSSPVRNRGTSPGSSSRWTAATPRARPLYPPRAVLQRREAERDRLPAGFDGGGAVGTAAHDGEHLSVHHLRQPGNVGEGIGDRKSVV